MSRLRVLMSAYGCEPGKGSEPGIGWNVAREMARRHDVWVITRANNRAAIESALVREPVAGLTFAYYDVPRWASWWKRGSRGVQLYYYLWQLGIHSLARRLHREVGFDVTHHVTFVKYWAPSPLARLPVPFLWGPVGGGDSTPRAFLADLSPASRRYERLREAARWVGERDPLVRLTARRAGLAVATTPETAAAVKRIGARRVETLSQVGFAPHEIASVGAAARRDGAFRVISLGNLLGLKGYHLGLRAFARLGEGAAEYWLVGDGPERGNLEQLARELGVAARVRFFGRLPRSEAVARLAECDVLLHPSLHDSGGIVCLEAMGAGKPVVCLDLGGPSLIVRPETGCSIPARDPAQAVEALSEALRRLAGDGELRARLGEAGRRRVAEEYNWTRKGEIFDRMYRELAGEGRT
jgi:glycosyltransferase involved in cell wall biosynthesis